MSGLGLRSSPLACRLRRSAGLLTLVIGALPALAAPAPPPDGAVRLKLDWEMMPPPGTPGVNRARLLAADTPALKSRLLKARDQVAALDQENAQKSERLTRHEDLITRMRGVVEAQEQIIARLQTQASQPVPRPSAQARPVAQIQAPAVRAAPAAAGAAPTDVAAAPIRIGPVALPAGMRDFRLQAAAAAVLILLLGFAAYRARARTGRAVTPAPGSKTAAAPALEEAPAPPPAGSPPQAERPAATAETETTDAARFKFQLAPEAELEAPKPSRPEPAPAEAAEDSGAGEASGDFPVLEIDDADPAADAKPAGTPGGEQGDAGKPAARPQVPPLILDLEADDETIDFLNDIYPQDKSGGGKAG